MHTIVLPSRTGLPRASRSAGLGRIPGTLWAAALRLATALLLSLGSAALAVQVDPRSEAGSRTRLAPLAVLLPSQALPSTDALRTTLANRLRGLGFEVITPAAQGKTGLPPARELRQLALRQRGVQVVQVVHSSPSAHGTPAAPTQEGAAHQAPALLLPAGSPRANGWAARLQRRLAVVWLQQPDPMPASARDGARTPAWMRPLASITPYVAQVRTAGNGASAGAGGGADEMAALAWGMADQACRLGFALAHCDPVGAPPEKRYLAAEVAALTPTQFQAPQTAVAARQAQQAQAMEAVRAALQMAPDTQRMPAGLPGWLSNIGLFNSERQAAQPHLLAALPLLPTLRSEQQLSLLSAAHGLYAVDAAAQLRPILSQVLPGLKTAREFAAAAYLLLAIDSSAQARLQVAQRLAQGFTDQADEPRLLALSQFLARRPGQSATPPPLADLLAAPFTPGFPVLFSVQRPNRLQRGLALVRGADGRFVRRADGSLLALPQLALARSNLPGTITNGNTPQGLFSVVGIGTAENPWIGPTPYLHSKLPLEAGVAEFRHGVADPDWNEAQYEALLPRSWRRYAPFKEAWLAGRAGRTEILAHGTTIDPAYYRGDSFAPGTPSAGCLVSDEDWGEDGRLRRSDQLSLVQAFAASGQERGFLVVVETGPGNAPVSLQDILPALTEAEARMKRSLRKR